MNDYINKIDNFMAPLANLDPTFGNPIRVARVGGSVRDEILGRRVKDADYVVFGCELERLGRILKMSNEFQGASVSPLKLRDGRQAGWRLFKKGYGLIEIMLPRTDVSTGPGHRDFEIVLDPNLTPAEDAKRRDFTFNALYKWIGEADREDPLEGVEDPTGRGLYDLQHKLVSTTYPHSFRDDPLRSLRALRFVSVLGYDLSLAAYAEMVEHAEAAHGLSQRYKARPGGVVERMDGKTLVPGVPEIEAASGTVLDEMSKLLMGNDCAKALRLMRDTGVMAVLLPELADMLGFEQSSKYHDLTTDEHTFVALEAATKAGAALRVRWALLFHDSGKPETAWTGDDGRKHYYQQFKELTRASIMHAPGTARVNKDHEVRSEELWRRFCERANVPKDLREDVATIIRHHMITLQPRNAGVKVRRWRVQFGDELLKDLLLHRACDCMGKLKGGMPQARQVKTLVEAQTDAIVAGVPACRKDLAITGGDIKELGARGRQIGEIQERVLDEVVCQPDELRRSREWQLSRAEAMIP